MTREERQRRRQARAEGQRTRIIRLLEALAGEDEQEQCPTCGQWFRKLSSHAPHCDGPGGNT